MNITSLKHPTYSTLLTDWTKYRDTYIGGSAFIEKYVKKYSANEPDEEFKARKEITYCPAHAKAALLDVKNAIYERLTDITREEVADTFKIAAAGEQGGVDNKGSSMTAFVGSEILPEMLITRRVGVYVDKPQQDSSGSKLDSKNIRPYIYTYHAEDILNWAYGPQNELTVVLLQDLIDKIDEETGLVTSQEEQYRLVQKLDTGVKVTIFDKNGAEVTAFDLELTSIPFVLYEITSSLLVDIADYQISLANLASTDMNYATKSNFPFYVEQFNPVGIDAGIVGDKTADTDGVQKHSVKVGLTRGRRYPKGLNQPDFINPSPDPLKVSMEKQNQLKEEIRQLINLTISNITPQRASAESKNADNHGLEGGLANIGLELESGERRIAQIWAEYEGKSNLQPIIKYPTSYTLKTEAEKRKEATDLMEFAPKIPSLTCQKTVAKRAVKILLSGSESAEIIKKINDEIEAAAVVVSDPETIKSDLEAGLVGVDLASQIRGYPAGQVEKAKQDHADRAARIALAQSEANQRGVADMGTDKGSAKEEKKNSQDAANSPTGEKLVRK